VQAHLIVPPHTWTTMLTDSRRNGQERHACYANIDSAHFSAHRNLLLENHRTTTSRGVSAPKRPETGRTRPVRKWATLVAAALFDYYSNWRYFVSARIKSLGGQRYRYRCYIRISQDRASTPLASADHNLYNKWDMKILSTLLYG